MEIHNDKQPIDYSSIVDTSRPFRSVKEAVAIFGDRLLSGELYAPKQEIISLNLFTSTPPRTPSPKKTSLVETLKKLENELEETKEELKLLKERVIETEVAVASSNAELHQNMSIRAAAEAEEARLVVFKGGSRKEFTFFRKNKNKKSKPIVPLVSDLFSRKKGSAKALHYPFFA